MLYFQEGSTANLTWTYTVNKTDELTKVTWRMLNKTEGAYTTLIVEQKDGKTKYNPKLLSTHGPERVAIEGQASLVIKNVTFKDSTIYKCSLQGKTANLENSVEMFVAGTCMLNIPILLRVIRDWVSH